jgi:hypothetical protein
MIGRRGFIGSLLAAFAAPKVVAELKPGDTFTMASNMAVNPPGSMLNVRVPVRFRSHGGCPIQINRISTMEFKWTESDFTFHFDGIVPVEEISREEFLRLYPNGLRG